MITNILYTGVVYASTIKPSNDTVIISILDNNSKYARPNFEGFKDFLLLSFKDRCEEDYGLTWDWPEEIQDEYAQIYTGIKNERLCNLSDAHKILNFFRLHHADPNPINLVVHCKAGVGRSAAIACWIGTKFKIKYSGNDPKGRFNPNLRIERLLNKANDLSSGVLLC